MGMGPFSLAAQLSHKTAGALEEVPACSLAELLNPGFREETVPRLSMLTGYCFCGGTANVFPPAASQFLSSSSD